MSPEASAYAAQYEALRNRMIAGDARGGVSDCRVRGLALAVLLQDGLPAWLAAVAPMLAVLPDIPVAARVAVAPIVVDERQSVRAIAPDLLPLAQHAEVTRLLAALVLSTARFAPCDPSTARTRARASR